MKSNRNTKSTKSKNDIFDQAALLTFDEDLKSIILECKNSAYPHQFKIVKDKIHSYRGNVYDFPSKPSDLFNIIYRIICDIEPRKISTTPSRIVRDDINLLEDAIYDYARRETEKQNKDDKFITLLFSCIITALFVERITPNDIVIKDGVVQHVPHIDTTIPRIIY